GGVGSDSRLEHQVSLGGGQIVGIRPIHVWQQHRAVLDGGLQSRDGPLHRQAGESPLRPQDAGSRKHHGDAGAMPEGLGDDAHEMSRMRQPDGRTPARRMCLPRRDFMLRIGGVMTAQAPSRSSLIFAFLSVLFLTAAAPSRDALAAAKHKHHKKAVHHKGGHAPSGGGSASSPEPGGSEESNEPTGSSSSGGASESSSESHPAAEPESSSSGGEEAAPAAKRKKVKTEEAAAGEESPSAPSGLPWLDISIGVAGYSRSFNFHQDADPVGTQLNPYSLPFWPVGVVNGVMYLEPLVDALSNLGIEGHFMQGFGVTSKFSNSTTSFTSTVHDYSGGLRYRFPFGAGNSIFISGRFGEDAFTFNGQN